MKDARLVAIMLHGRGASAEDILGLADQFSARDVAYLAPQAEGATWYPFSFLRSIANRTNRGSDPPCASSLAWWRTSGSKAFQQNGLR